MNETKKPQKRPSLLEGSRTDLAAEVLPRCPDFPPSNYTYAKRCEAMRGEAEACGQNAISNLKTRIAEVKGVNTYARATRAYGAILLEHLDREAQLAEAVKAAEAQIAEAVAEDSPAEKASKAANAATVKRKVAKKPAAKEAA